MKTLEFEVGRYRIEMTRKEFKKYSDLIAFDVSAPNQYCCTLCNKTFKTGNGASIHLNKYHDTVVVKTILKK